MLSIKIKIVKILINLSYYFEVRWDTYLLFRILRWMIYLFMKFLFGMIPYQAISHKAYCRQQNTDVICIKRNRVGYSSNVITNKSKDSQKLIPCIMDDLLLCHHKTVFIQGGSGIVLDFKRRLAINDYCAKMDETKSYQDIITKSTKRKVLLLKLGRKNRYKLLPAGIMISDRYANNYYHGLYEILIRLLVLEDIDNKIPSNVPIVVDEAILKIPSLKRAFELLTNNINRSIHIIKEGERLLFDNLWCITPVNSFLHIKANSDGSPEYFVFDKEYTLKLRDRLLSNKSSKVFPKKVFITRASTKHRNFNEEDVFSVLEPMGFQKVSPEILSFEEQMSLFDGAEWIVSGAGAAFTNLLFSSIGCRVICLYQNFKGYVAPVFTTPAYFNGCAVYYYSDNSIETIDVHSNYTINAKSLKLYLKTIQ